MMLTYFAENLVKSDLPPSGIKMLKIVAVELTIIKTQNKSMMYI